MTASKYLIVSVDFDDYGRFIAQYHLPGGSCFQCESFDEAWQTARRNAEWGIPVTILHTPEWGAKNTAAKERAA